MRTVKKNKVDDYTPQTEPMVIDKIRALKADSTILKKLPKAKVLEGIMSPDEPWVGGCRYLLCFTSLFMHVERHHTNYYTDKKTLKDFNGHYGLSTPDTDIAILNRERVYKVFLTATGMGLANSWSTNGYPHSYEIVQNYVDRSMKFAGYQYETVMYTDGNQEAIMDKIRIMINSDIPVLARYTSGWELVIGYDTEAKTIMLRKGNETAAKNDFTEELEYLVCVTDTGYEPTEVNTVVSNIIETMETGGEGFGPQAYYEAIDFFSNDDFFDHASDDQLEFVKYQMWDYFVSHAEARGFSGIGFGWRFFNRNAEGQEAIFNQISYYGDLHHQTAWCGWHVIDSNAQRLKDHFIREKIVYIIYSMIENDMQVCRLLKKLIGLETPDVLLPIDQKSGRVFVTEIQTEEVSAEQILEKIKVKSSDSVNFNSDIEPCGEEEVKWEVVSNAIRFQCKNDWSSMVVQKEYAVPLQIDMRVKTEGSSIYVYYKSGNLLLGGNRMPGEMRITDISTKLDIGYSGGIKVNEFTDVSWILHRHFTAVIVNGKTIHFGTNYPYMNLKDFSTASICFGATAESRVVVESFKISELE